MVILEDRRLLFKLFSLLLQYPDEELKGSVRGLQDGLACFSEVPSVAGCLGFLAYLERTPLVTLQEEYVRTFDLRPATCLNLTFHECGDGKIRGAALADLSQLYKSEGYEPSRVDLPDFLPLVLEFLSVCSPETGSQVLARYAGPIRGLAQRLGQQASPYGHLLEALSLLGQEFMGTGD
ncbi:MAG: nitrate reductase molybdenum cofactor assembly chaperone [Desulfomonile tiedjei]|nr:nitrate reductase molybdenum cofactor assembly chaperone [Desulfomonile tiedjei]